MAFNFNKGGSYNGYEHEDDYGSYDNDARYGSNGYGEQEKVYSGFQNMPTSRNEMNDYRTDDMYDNSSDDFYPEPSLKKWPIEKKRQPFRNNSMPRPVNRPPLKLIFIIFCVVFCLIFCWIFREEITAFIVQILVWMLAICIVVGVVKFIFRKSRR